MRNMIIWSAAGTEFIVLVTWMSITMGWSGFWIGIFFGTLFACFVGGVADEIYCAVKGIPPDHSYDEPSPKIKVDGRDLELTETRVISRVDGVYRLLTYSYFDNLGVLKHFVKREELA